MNDPRSGWMRSATVACALALCLLAGCKSEQEKALDQAKAQAAATNTAQQIQYIDKNGDTVTTIVAPPVSGQPQQISTSTAAAPPGPKPSATRPVITPAGQAGNGAMMAAPNNATTAGPGAPRAGNAMMGSSTPPPIDGAGPVPGGAGADTTGVYPAVGPEPAPASNSTPAPAVNIAVPAGTELAIRINQRINVKYAHAGDAFTGEVVNDVTRGGNVAIPRGTPVRGRIDAAHRRGHFKGASILELRLTSMTLNGNRYELDTHDNVHAKKGKGRRTGGFIGGMTAAGAVIGGIASGGLGAGVGAGAGAGVGTLIAGTTGNRDIVIPAESIQHFRLAEPLYVQNQ